MAKEEIKLVLEKLEDIKSELDYIKEHMVDIDTILTPEEEERLEESLTDLKECRTTPLEEFDKEMKRNVQHRTR